MAEEMFSICEGMGGRMKRVGSGLLDYKKNHPEREGCKTFCITDWMEIYQGDGSLLKRTCEIFIGLFPECSVNPR